MALDVVSDVIDLPSILNGDARAFRPHISVLPRFKMADNDAVRFPPMHALIGLSVELSAPEDNGTGLWWCECRAGMRGYAELIALHEETISLMANVANPVTPHFWREGYRPHLTLGDKPGLTVSPQNIEVTVDASCLYKLRDSPTLIVERHL